MRTNFTEEHTFPYLVKQSGIALLMTLGFYFTVGYVNTGVILWPWRYISDIYIEFILAFIYVLSLLILFRRLSFYLHSREAFLGFFALRWIEIVSVLIIALVLFILTNYIPLKLVYPDLEFPPVRLRTAFAFAAMNALFINYFIVGYDYQRRLAAEKLQSSRLAKEKYEAELTALKQQVNPHFLFNSLNVLGALIQSDPVKASQFNEKLADVYRAFLINSKEDLLPLDRELELVEAYAFLIKTRLADGVQFHLKLGESCQSFLVPPGSIQTLVENALKHNRATPMEPLHIKIDMRKDILIVTNNLQTRSGVKSDSMVGLQNLESRLKLLTGKSLKIHKTDQEFIVHLPLISHTK